VKIVISADMEGTCGVVNWIQVDPPPLAGAAPSSSEEYERARLRMTREVNAAAEGAFAAGASEVLVNDSHDWMCNLLPDELLPGVRFISGSEKPLDMAQGVDEEGVAALFLTGYHARAGTPTGPLAHTMTGWVHDVRVNGVSMGEYGVNALIAGHFGVPVALVTGDDQAVAQTRDLLGEQVVGVVVKHGFSETSAAHLHPEEAQRRIRTGAEEAVRNLAAMKPYRFPEGATVEIDLDHQTRVNQALQIPTVRRAGWRTLAFEPADALEFNTVFSAIQRVGSRA
jgi:D-amino peptidase